jgi:hypothetical protein
MSDLKTHFVLCCKHSALVMKTDTLILYRENIAVYSEIHTKHISAMWEENRIYEC